MTNKRLDITTVIGRFVYGSLYKPYTKDTLGNPLTFKADGSPRSEYRIGLAIRKGQEQHWNQTSWGQLIFNFAQQAFPGGQTQSPYFSWKIIDGDSTIPNRNNKKPCDKEGYPGHWVISWSNNIPPVICDTQGQKILEIDRVNKGDYIQVHGNVAANKSVETPGLYFNSVFVAFAGIGERISDGPDLASVQWGGQLPPEAKPIGSMPSTMPFGTPSGMPPVQQAPMQQYMPPAQPAPMPHVQPYPNILNTQPAIPMPTPAPAHVPTRIMTPKAAGFTYEQFLSIGHTDESLVREGYMVVS